jgi:hypothetical protein
MPRETCRYQSNRVEFPGANPHIYSQLILDKVAKTYSGERTASSMNGAGKKLIIYM